MLSPCLIVPPAECRDTADTPADPPGRVIPINRRRRRPGDWRPERPRERLLERGPAALTDDELIALLLGTGKPGHDVFVTARALVEQFGTLRGLLEASADDFEAYPGIGPARSARLVAVTEIARRMLVEKAEERMPIDSPGAVEDCLRLKIGTRQYEVFIAVYLDARNRLIDMEEIARGSLTRMAVYPREIVRRAMKHNAAALIVAHNHPSGAVQPNAEDRRLTRVLKDALELVDVRLLDHVVVGVGNTFSFARAGWL
ncbi:RadC family protein [Burkholderia cenocepacia]|uniref:JAB domain-containing protein n=1 Tax=Burkholderia cenocepacia TaxID=95486 RepID=A0A6B2MFL9_9BURK|nr:DNA repair protein RadC [Burkholderia cenocepacia]NDV74330.1 JAB domain-containing protein [Burkholderia cenocepacia]